MADDTADDKKKSVAIELEAAVGPVKAKLSLTDVVFSDRAIRHRIKMGVADSLLEKLKQKEALTDLELFLLGSTFEKELKRTERAAAVIARAAELVPSMKEQMKALPPPSEEGRKETTSPEFAARVLRDAEDVSDDDVRERYARLIAGEVAKPGSFSLRTLSVFRDLDSEAARKFEAVTNLLVAGRYLPSPRMGGRDLYDMLGVTVRDLRTLQEFGLLIEAAPAQHGTAEFTLPDGGVVGILTNNDNHLVIRIYLDSPPVDKPRGVELPALMLTAAGRELATLPARQRDLTLLRELAVWVARGARTNDGRATVRWYPAEAEAADGSVEHALEFDPPVVYPEPPTATP